MFSVSSLAPICRSKPGSCCDSCAEPDSHGLGLPLCHHGAQQRCRGPAPLGSCLLWPLRWGLSVWRLRTLHARKWGLHTLLHAGRCDSTHCCMLQGGNSVSSCMLEVDPTHCCMLGGWISINCCMLEVSISTHIRVLSTRCCMLGSRISKSSCMLGVKRNPRALVGSKMEEFQGLSLARFV